MSCVFCGIAEGTVDAHVVLDTPEVVAFLDARPLFPGHTLVVPRRHLETIDELPDDLLATLFCEVRRMKAAVQTAMEAHGVFIANNNTVSQSVPHLHVHVVPRRFKDGLRGFFWPRGKYESDEEAAEVAELVRRQLSH